MFWLKFVTFFKSALGWMHKWLKKLWEGIKKTPAIVLGVLGASIAIGVYLWSRYRTEKAKAKVTKELVTLERDHTKKLTEAVNENEEAKEAIEKEFNEKKTALEEKAKEIESDLSKGPSGIADAWNKYLKGGGE